MDRSIKEMSAEMIELGESIFPQILAQKIKQIEHNTAFCLRRMRSIL
ncbi:UNVERIFIED_CONTAM: hypothetical protein ABIC26_003672 [Paenibacillus sp. PvR008]